MSLVSRRPVLRWLAPVAVVAVVAGGAVIGKAVATGSAPAALPTITAAQLLADIEQAKPTPMSGTVVESADLGLPDLSSLTGGGSSDGNLTSLISGTHTLRVWYGSGTQQRLAVLDSLGESDIVRNGTDLWIWDSKANTASHRTLSTHDRTGGLQELSQAPVPTDPQSAAQTALDMVDKTTTVSVTTGVTVAGRATYELSLAPKAAGSLIKAVRIAVDGATYTPLRVQVDAVGGTTPAFSVGFTSVDFTAPDASEFSFTPPPGATVSEGGTNSGSSTTWGNGGGSRTPDSQVVPGPQTSTGDATAAAAPKVVGSDWTSVLVATIPTTQRGAGSSADPLTSMTAQLNRIASSLPSVSGSWGSGHLLSGTVFSAVLTDDHRIAIGAVSPELLYQALGSK